MAKQPFFRYMNKKATADAVRALINPMTFEKEFESDMLSDLISEKHYFCSRHGLRPTRFRKSRRLVGDYDLQGWFNEHDRWHSVSWYQCVYPRRDQDWIARALRDAIAPELASYRRSHPICERCGAAAADEVHHAEPTFRKIVEGALNRLTESDWQAIVDQFDWWSTDPFSLPPTSPALAALLDIHASAQLIAVCRPCHQALERAHK